MKRFNYARCIYLAHATSILLLFFVASRRFSLPASPLFTKWPKRQRLFLELISVLQKMKIIDYKR